MIKKIILFLMCCSIGYCADSVKINDKEAFIVTDTDKIILANDLLDVNSEIERRLKYIIDDKVNNCYARLYKEWVTDGKLESLGVTSIPTKRDDVVALIVARPEYKNRVQRDAEEVII